MNGPWPWGAVVMASLAAACGSGAALDDGEALAVLVRAVSSDGDAGPRFSAGFSVPDGGLPSPDQWSPQALAAAADLERSAATGDPSDVHGYATAQILAGRLADAAVSLEQVTSATPASSTAWADLAGVYLLQAGRSSEQAFERLLRAIDVATSAVEASPSSVDAWFNRALAIDRAGLLSVEDAWAIYRAFAGVPAPAESPVNRDVQWNGAEAEIEAADVLARADVDRWLPELAQPLREYLEDRALPQWGVAVSGGAVGADRALQKAETLARALAEHTGDTLLVDTIQQLRDQGTADRLRLASAFDRYGQAREAFRGERYRDALTALNRATRAFRDGSSPFWMRAAIQRAATSFYLRDLDALERDTDDVRRGASGRAYPLVRGRAAWLRGVIDYERGDIDSAIRQLTDALQAFERAGEEENAATIANSLAAMLRTIGDTPTSWAYLSRAFSSFSRLRDPGRDYVFLSGAALFAQAHGLARASVFLQDGAVAAARRRESAGMLVEGLAERAAARLQAGDTIGAGRDLARAENELAAVASPEARAQFEAGIARISADVLTERRPDQAVRLLEGAIARQGVRWELELPRLFLRLARLSAETEPSRALGYLNEGIQRFEAGRATVASAAQRVSFLDEEWDLYAERLALQFRMSADSAALFEELDNMKARVLRELQEEAITPATVEDVRGPLGADEALISFAILPEEVLAVAVTGGDVSVVHLETSPEELTRVVTEYRRLLALDRDVPALEREARRLFDLVLAPLDRVLVGTDAWVVVPDGILHALPFATLRTPAGRFVIEQVGLVTAPSAAVWLKSADRTRVMTGPPRSALVIGDPAFDRSRFPTLRPLTQARLEAGAVRRMYPEGRLLVGAAATADAIRDARGYEVLHFAGHAIENPEYPWRSALVLTAEADDPGTLYADEIAGLPLDGVDLVVLAACETGFGRVYRGEGVVSLTMPFLAAGVPSVVSTLWEVEDAAARTLFERFHVAIAAGESAPTALRNAQLALLRENRDAIGSPRQWGAYTATSAF